jgi:hypothetical protein
MALEKTVNAFKELAQNGLGVRRAPQRAAGFFPCLGARSRALCALLAELHGIP